MDHPISYTPSMPKEHENIWQYLQRIIVYQHHHPIWISLGQFLLWRQHPMLPRSLPQSRGMRAGHQGCSVIDEQNNSTTCHRIPPFALCSIHSRNLWSRWKNRGSSTHYPVATGQYYCLNNAGGLTRRRGYLVAMLAWTGSPAVITVHNQLLISPLYYLDRKRKKKNCPAYTNGK